MSQPLSSPASSYQQADRSDRVVAILVDVACAFIVVGLPGLVVLLLGSHSALRMTIYGVSAILLALQLFLLWRDGQTIGKKAAEIRIVPHDEGARLPAFVQVVVLRTLLPGLLFLIPTVGALLALIDLLFALREDERCLHDHLANTRVVQA